MGLIERLYAAAESAGLLVHADVAGRTVAVGFAAPDRTVLDGLVRSTDYAITYPTSALPDLAVGQTLVIAGVTYAVRDRQALADGTEQLATLTRLDTPSGGSAP